MDTNAKKTALRMVSYGLYVVTTHTENERGACLVNWLTQCSFEPPMIVIAFEQDAHTLKVLQQSGRFAVNVLETGQRELAGWFGRHHAKVGDKLANRETQASPSGAILLPEALSWFECELRAQTPAGDHVLVMGEVVAAGVQREGTPLSLKETGFRYAG
jgi:flavin reductase (DIM6/NTAB) family NADH-FMN oxidoreductase RutF